MKSCFSGSIIKGASLLLLALSITTTVYSQSFLSEQLPVPKIVEESSSDILDPGSLGLDQSGDSIGIVLPSLSDATADIVLDSTEDIIPIVLPTLLQLDDSSADIALITPMLPVSDETDGSGDQTVEVKDGTDGSGDQTVEVKSVVSDMTTESLPVVEEDGTPDIADTIDMPTESLPVVDEAGMSEATDATMDQDLITESIDETAAPSKVIDGTKLTETSDVTVDPGSVADESQTSGLTDDSIGQEVVTEKRETSESADTPIEQEIADDDQESVKFAQEITVEDSKSAEQEEPDDIFSIIDSLYSDSQDEGLSSDGDDDSSHGFEGPEVDRTAKEVNEVVQVVEAPKITRLWLEKIQEYMEQKEYNLALTKLTEVGEKVEEGIDSEEEFFLLEYRQFLLIRSNFHLGNYEQTVDLCREYFKKYGNGDHYYKSYYYFSESLMEVNQPLELTSLVTDEFFSALSPSESDRLRKNLIRNSLNEKRPYEAFSFLDSEEGILVEGYKGEIEDIIKVLDDVEDIDAILERDPEPSVRSSLYLKKVQLLIRNGTYQEAEDFLNLLMQSEELNEQLYGELQGLQTFITIALNTNPSKIGVVLPFSHKRFGSLARQVRDGLELALQEFSTADRPIKLVFKDSTLPRKRRESKAKYEERTQKWMQQLVRELVEDEHVIAILGPLSKSPSLAAGNTAERYKIPVISFSLTENIGEKHPFLFRFQKNRIHEAETLVEYSMDYLNAKRFVLFYPSTKSGLKMMKAFHSKVRERGGDIAGIVRVRKKQQDFQDSFMSVTGGYRQVSEEEKEELAAARERLKPIIDFDAIFAPLPLPVLKNFNSYVSLFNAEKTWILSDSSINIKENQSLTKNIERLRFVDTFAISSAQTYLQPFFESHWKSFNYRTHYQPPTDYTIYGYEALELLSNLLNNPAYHNRESLRNSLNELDSYQVLTGKVSTRKNGELTKRLRVLRIHRKSTIPVD